ncbi:MAG TPA: hypothetical protein ENJ18_15515 [Nannocystis exedens]|nr:hypothetical protein [Nannocystis exedens]
MTRPTTPATPIEADPCAPSGGFPEPVFNRPALPVIRRRVGDYKTIREALIYRLDRAPGLERWTYRGPEDPGIALLEGAAIVGDILAFYQDLYANEAYLRTAKWRENVGALCRLTGYRLRPGLGGVATLALEIDSEVPVIAPAGHGFVAEIEGVEDPVRLESLTDTLLIPGLSTLSLCAPQDPQLLRTGTRELRLRASSLGEALPRLGKGDRLLLAIADDDDSTSLRAAQIVLVESTRILHGELVVKLQGGLVLEVAASELVAFKIDRSLRHFGGNAPPYEVVPDVLSSTGIRQDAIHYKRSLTKTTTAPFLDPSLGAREIPLAVPADQLGVGTTVVCEWSFGGARRGRRATVIGTQAASLRWGALTGHSTLLTLDRPLIGHALARAEVIGGHASNHQSLQLLGESTSDRAHDLFLDLGFVDIRSMAIHTVEGAAMKARARPSDRSGAGKELAFFGTAKHARALVGRRIAFTRPADATPTITRITSATVVTDPLQSVLSSDGVLGALHTLTLDVDVSYADFASSPVSGEALTIYGNLIDVDQGKTEAEVVLGSGDARRTFQSFRIPKAPLTYHRDPGSTPPEVPELTVYVQGRVWTRVDALFGHAEADEIYTVREDDEGRSYVLFGDGKTGARLPSGVDNIRVCYRRGTAAYGPKKIGTSLQARPIDIVRIKKVHLLGEVSGGASPETAEGARGAAPAKVQTLDRLVSVADFEAEARSLSGVLRARARWELDDHMPAIVITLLMECGRQAELASIEKTLRRAGRCRGPDRVPVVVRPGIFEHVFLILRYGLAPGYREKLVRPAIAAVLGLLEAGKRSGEGLFSETHRDFGEAERATRIEGYVQRVKGVAWCRIAALKSLGEGDLEGLEVPAAATRAEVLRPISSAHMLRLNAGPRGDLVSLLCAGTEGSAGCE